MPFIAVIHIDGTTPPGDILAQQHTLEQIYGSRLVGLFEYPERKDIGCTGNCSGKGRLSSFSRDPRGFMKCNICGKRNRKVRTWLTGALFDFLGANLYPKAPAVFRTPEGYGKPPA
jgi:hypothetical protein